MGNVPFNLTEHEKEEMIRQIVRFWELYPKFEHNLNEALEFAKLYKQLVVREKIFKLE